MINYVYQIVSPGVISIKYDEINFDDKVIVRPRFMALCHADHRYYMGNRDINVLRNKFPMALIHECCGEVVFDSTKTYSPGQKVVMIPNVPPKTKQNEIYENYAEGAGFLSSGHDGFMREFVSLSLDRVVPFENADARIAAIAEFISVGVHAVNRFKNTAHNIRNTVGIWGDGSLGYVLVCVLKKMLPETKLVVMGRDASKLSQFSFADEIYLTYEMPEDFRVDHAFECAGGEGSYFAIDDIIKYINPQGTTVLLGVSENKVAINTRDILEKGLTFVGSSRSGREDFKKAVELLEQPDFQKKISRIVYQDEKVSSVKDIHRVFKTDLNNAFKTVFEWNL